MLISKFENEKVEDEVVRFEDKYQIKLPEQYRKFMLQYNGGNTPKTNFKIGKISSDINGFYGFSVANEFLDFHKLESKDCLKEFLESNQLPIAFNDFGDKILLGLSGDCEGKIYFSYHDKPQNYVMLTESLKDFFNKCKSEKLGHIRTIEERKQCLIDNGKGDKITDIKIACWQKEIDKYGNMNQEELVLH